MIPGSYTMLAHVYDELNGEADYPSIADAIETCFADYLPQKPELVLDLACGTGCLTAELAKRGYDMIGADVSADMLCEARKNAQGYDVLLLNQDMRSFELYGTVGAIVCTFDSLNYLVGDGELQTCFSLAHNYLDPDGLFLFDMNMPNKFAHFYGEHDFILEDPESKIYCGWQNEYNEEDHICHFFLSVFEEKKNGLYERHDEEQEERAYSLSEIKATLEMTGFELLQCSHESFAGKNACDESADRLYFVARCKKEVKTYGKT